MIEDRKNNGNYPDPPKLITKKMAAKILGVSEYAIRNLVKSGVLKKCENIGERPWYFTQTHLNDFIQRLSEGNR